MLKENQFLICGTGSGGGTPLPFCGCPICTRARQEGSYDLRTRAGYQLGERIRFDWSPDVAWQAQRFGLDFSRLRYLFITHSHSDHFYSEDFWTRNRLVSEGVSGTLKMFGNAAVKAKLCRDAPRYLNYGIEFQELTPGETVEVDSTRITALPADHIPEETALLYWIEQRGKTLLLGHDSQLYPEFTMEFLRGKHCDYFLPDATWGTEQKNPLGGHMGLPDNIALFKRFVAQGTMDETTQVYPTHIAPNHGNFHQDLVNYLQDYANFNPAYDGLILEL